MGDDVGWSNVGAIRAHVFDNAGPRQGSERSHALHRLLRRAICTSGRANFITADPPIRTCLTTVSQAGAKIGIPGPGADDCDRVEGAGINAGANVHVFLGNVGHIGPIMLRQGRFRC
jgi:hypothetical protein